MGVVTVIGAGGSVINLPFSGNDATNLAQALANVINKGVTTGELTPVTQTGSAAPLMSGATPGELILTTAGTTNIPAAGNGPGYDAIVVKANNQTITDNQTQSGQSVVGSGYNMNFAAFGGSGTVVGGGGSPDSSNAGSQIVIDASAMSSWLVDFDHGNNTVNAISGNVTVEGNASNSVILGAGNDLVVVNNQSSVQAGSGADTITVNDRQGLPSGSGGHPLTASAYVLGGSGSLTFFANASNNTVLGGTGSETIFGGTGASLYQGGSAGNNYIAGAGTLLGGGSGDTLMAQGSVNTLLKGGTGNESLSAFSSTGNDTLVAGAGNDTLTMGSGHDIVEFVKGAAGGSEMVLGFSGADSVSLSGYGSGTAGVTSIDQVGGSLEVTLSDNTKITFAGYTDKTNLHISG